MFASANPLTDTLWKKQNGCIIIGTDCVLILVTFLSNINTLKTGCKKYIGLIILQVLK